MAHKFEFTPSGEALHQLESAVKSMQAYSTGTSDDWHESHRQIARHYRKAVAALNTYNQLLSEIAMDSEHKQFMLDNPIKP